MEVTKDGAQLEFDCATGAITEPLAPDSRGYFRLKGTLTPEHSGPIRQGEVPQAIDATYSGVIENDTMTLQLIIRGKELAHFALKRGQQGKLVKCR
jgi:hypothetical protein